MLMSALGDYVHLNTANYIAYGTKEEGEGSNFPATVPNDLLVQRTKNIKRISQNTLMELRKRIANDSYMQEQRDEKKIQEKYQKQIDETVKQIFNKNKKK